MSYEQIAEGSGAGLTLEIYEQDADPQTPVAISLADIVEKKGHQTPRKYAPHLPFEMQISVFDFNRFILDRFRKAPIDKFKAIFKEGANVYSELYFNTRFSDQEYYKPNNIIELSTHDGVKLLTRKDIITGTKQIGNLIEELIHLTGTALDVIISTDLDSSLASGQNDIIPNQWRVKEAEAFVRGISNPTAYNQLMAVLEHYKFQMWQEDGVWRVVEREARRGATIKICNISQDTHSTTDPRLTLQEADVRRPSYDNHSEQIGKVSRLIDHGAHSYDFKNPGLESWNGDELLHWTIEDPDAMERYEDGDDVGVRTIQNSNLIAYQHPLYTVRYKDVIGFRYFSNFAWQSGLPAGNTWTVEFARVILLSPSTVDNFGLNVNTGEFESGHDGIISRTIDTDSYTPAATISHDVEVEIPAAGRLLFEIFYRGDTGVIADDPEINAAALDGVKINDNFTRVRYESIIPELGEDFDESVAVAEANTLLEEKVIGYSDLQYYDGTEWLDSGTLADFWGTDTPKISQLIVKKIAESSQEPDQLVDAHVDHNLAVKLFNTVNYNATGSLKSYVPHFIQYNRKAKRKRLKLIETKSTSVDVPEITYE